jgi:hypothetical protein
MVAPGETAPIDEQLVRPSAKMTAHVDAQMTPMYLMSET